VSKIEQMTLIRNLQVTGSNIINHGLTSGKRLEDASQYVGYLRHLHSL
jgi:hypothetical protein